MTVTLGEIVITVDSDNTKLTITDANGGTQRLDWRDTSSDLINLTGIVGDAARAAVRDYLANSSSGAIDYTISVSS
jgi:hypothetical protein